MKGTNLIDVGECTNSNFRKINQSNDDISKCIYNQAVQQLNHNKQFMQAINKSSSTAASSKKGGLSPNSGDKKGMEMSLIGVVAIGCICMICCCLLLLLGGGGTIFMVSGKNKSYSPSPDNPSSNVNNYD